ncbi:MAG: AAA domain-containing protein, partial [Balneolaceae bacterium]
MNIQDLINQAKSALENEIEAVRKKPSTDILFDGERIKSDGGGKGRDYKFETHHSSIRYAEEIKAKTKEKEFVVKPVFYENNEIVLQFPEAVGEKIDELHVEWENDFVLKRMLSEIEILTDASEVKFNRIDYLFNPEPKQKAAQANIKHDGLRNSAQEQAIQKALAQRTLFIWGPPGTGKTDTLGYINANYLSMGKNVLFVSNTNRAVDIGLLSTIHALRQIGEEELVKSSTRFGEAALDQAGIQSFLFDEHIQKKIEKKKEQAADWINLLRKQQDLKERIEMRLRDGKQPTNNQELELKLVDQKIKNAGGQEALEELISEHSSINEAMELRKFRFVATTLAKVCTSDLFHNMEFDAVVIDEGSMANLPYLMVMASRARRHIVVVGDPMQLPPISVTDDRESR